MTNVQHRIERLDNQGYAVPTRTFERGGGKAAPPAGLVVVLPAMGVRSTFYDRLAGALLEVGLSAVVVEQRGQRESSLRPSHGVDWGYHELTSDVLRVLGELRARHPGVPITLLGHSLGGHLCLTCAALAPEAFDAMVLAASGSPYRGHFTGVMGWQLLVGLWTMRPLETLLGYFPGRRTGFAGNEARTVMRDWRHLVRHDRFRCAGMPDDLEDRMGRYTGPVLGLSFERDSWAPAAAAASFHRKLERAELTTRTLSEADLGCPAGHFDWAKKPERVAREVAAWRLSSS